MFQNCTICTLKVKKKKILLFENVCTTVVLFWLSFNHNLYYIHQTLVNGNTSLIEKNVNNNVDVDATLIQNNDNQLAQAPNNNDNQLPQAPNSGLLQVSKILNNKIPKKVCLN